MKLTIVGCAGSAPAAGEPASCYLIEADGYRLVLDLGSGALVGLQKVVAAHEIDAIFLSHLHPDHCLDLPSLAVILRFGGQTPRRPIPVVAPVQAAVRLLDAYYPGSPASTFEGLFDFRGPGQYQLGPFALRTAPMHHPVPALGVRIEHAGRSFAYSGDTATCPALVELARAADVLLCEAAWGGSAPPVPGIHLSGREAGEHAQRAGARRLLITHVPAWESVEGAVIGARQTYDGDVTAVESGQTYTV
jgi:ribonuclease BN (tRNA processing enzyme)